MRFQHFLFEPFKSYFNVQIGYARPCSRTSVEPYFDHMLVPAANIRTDGSIRQKVIRRYCAGLTSAFTKHHFIMSFKLDRIY